MPSPAQTVKTIPGGLEGRSPPFLIESGDMRGGFVRLAQQGFLTLFPAREPLGGERETALYTRKRTPQADFFDTLVSPRLGGGDVFIGMILFLEG